MPWTGGVYTRGYASWTSDANSALPISATKFDTEDNDFAAGLNNCLTIDGLNKPTATLNWAQNLNLTRGSDGNVWSLARTGGANNPKLQGSVTDASGVTLAATAGGLTFTSSAGLSLTPAAGGLTFTAAGNATLTAPTSGVAATLNVVDNTAALALNEAAFTSGYYLAFQVAGTTKSFIGFGGIMGNGTGQNDLAVECNVNTGNINLIQGNTSGKIQGFGPVAAAMVDMTPDTGTFTGTLTGCTTSPTTTFTWARVGKLVMLYNAASLTGTSNSGACTITGVPAAIQPTNTQSGFAVVQNAGSSVPGTWTLAGGTISLTNGSGGTFAAFTASGTKGIPNAVTMVYPLN